MYDLYLGKLLLPVTPQKISTRISNQNRTLTLISEGEINILKSAGLTEISFTALIPQVKYPFARYESGEFEPASEYLEYLERLKTGKAPFQFILSRWLPNGSQLFDTNLTVSLEDYSISEDAKNGFDLEVDIRLKQYREYGAKLIDIGSEIPTAPVAVQETRSEVSNPEKKKSSGSSKKSSKKKSKKELEKLSTNTTDFKITQRAQNATGRSVTEIVKSQSKVVTSTAAAAKKTGVSSMVSKAKVFVKKQN